MCSPEQLFFLDEVAPGVARARASKRPRCSAEDVVGSSEADGDSGPTLEEDLATIMEEDRLYGDGEEFDMGWDRADDAAASAHELETLRRERASAGDVLDGLAMDASLDAQEGGAEGVQCALFERLLEGAVDAGSARLGHHGPRVDEALQSWPRSLAFSRGALDWLEAALEAAPAIGCAGSGLSLSLVVAGGGDVHFVHWRSYGEIGQTVVLDEDNKVKFSTPAFFPMVDMSSATIVVPDCGVRMEKVRRKERPVCPATALRLRDMLQNALGVGCSGGGILHCSACGGHGSTDLAEPALCPLCLLAWHPACANAVAAHSLAESCIGATARLPALPALLDAVLDRAVCVLCCRKV